MLNGKKIIVVMPAYQAERTLQHTYAEIPLDFVDEVILVDDGSLDNTANLAKALGLVTLVHLKNLGYGRNQKTCYREALKRGADIVIMVHPDSQYSPKLIVSLAGMLAYGVYDVALGSRILGVGAIKGGMPVYKYVANRLLTFLQNIFLNYKLSEYHTGYRAFARHVLEALPLEANGDDFVFDNQMLSQIIFVGYHIGEISCPTRYFPQASSINFGRSLKYGFGVLVTCLQFRLQKLRLAKFRIFSEKPASIPQDYYQFVEK
jgi:glycosyltransferase involved in cell wall biosynthesis